MGGKSKKTTVGYWYKPLFHHGLCEGPIDAFLEWRCGDKTAWSGRMTGSGMVSINKPDLFGGETDQGGVVGTLELMFGEADQLPNDYLLANLGEQVPGWRGLTTALWRGGKYGAMSAYPQAAAYKVQRIFNNWDGETWYPEKAAVGPAAQFAYDGQWKYLVTPPEQQDWNDPAASNFDDSAWSEGKGGFGTGGPGGGLGVGTYVSSGTVGKGIWIRKQFAASAGMPIEIDAWHDDGAWLWFNGQAIELVATEDYFHSTATIPGDLVQPINVIAFKVLDSVPSGAANNIYAGLDLAQADSARPWMNPTHILYQAETDPGMGREPLANIHLASFTAAADWFFEQGFGLCADRDPSAESVDEFKERIQKVAACSTSRSLMDGLIYFDIANGVYTLAELPILTEDDILEWSEQPTTLNNAVNSVSVKYFDVGRKEDVTTPPVQALDLIDAFGLNHQTIEYPEIPDSNLALRVASRELLALTTPLRAFDLKTTRAAYAYRPNQYVRLQAPRRGITDMVCIVASKESGSLKSGAIALKLSQDIYSLPQATLIEVEPGAGAGTGGEPQPIVVQRAFEVPYTDLARTLASGDLADLTAESSFVQAVAVSPTGGKNFAMQTQPAGGQYALADTGEWCPSALIVEADDTRLETEFTLASASGIEAVQPSSAALWGAEIVRVVSVTPTGVGLSVTLARGCVDTVPQVHDAGERIWFYDSVAAVDPTEYAAGETVNVKLLTNTTGAQLSIDAATAMAVVLGGRAALPYPPGKVKIAGGDWPDTVAGEFVVTWAHRNRFAQADQVIDTSVASVTPPDNQRYGLRFKDSSNALLVEKTSIGPGTATVSLNYTGGVTMELWTIDNGGTSVQRHVHTFGYTPADPAPAESTITADDYVPVYDGTIIDGGDLDG
ncbi:MAG: hypothetical protein DI597_00735 [Pseudoxanthomonas spadix]|nr:MAG: hypothetical protein DI597_00735 [Pseudoxanthomonas spadix]